MRIFIALLLVFSGAVSAVEFPVTAGIYLVDAQQNETRIGDVSFTDVGSGKSAVKVEINNDKFTDHFLSMRPFRCLEGQTEWFCYLPYPYDLRSIVTPEDLTDLEYQLLFLLKRPEEFGIDAWNGLYYKLDLEADGSIIGKLLEGDLNSLQSPPGEKYARSVDLGEFIPASVQSRLFPTLRIY